jgi:hypothetical protein
MSQVVQLPTKQTKTSIIAKLLMWLGVILVVCFWIGMQTIFAKPGDLLFFPKLLIERNQTDFAASFTALQDRMASYTQLLQQNRCAQAVLAENELVAKLQQTSQLAGVADPNIDLNPAFASWLANLPATIKTNCSTVLPLPELAQIGRMLLFYRTPASYQHTADFVRMQQVLNYYEQLKQASHDFGFDTQAKLNSFNSLMLAARAEIAQMNVLARRDSWQTIKLQARLDTIAQILEYQNKSFDLFEHQAFAGCLLNPKHSLCQTSSAFAAKWNSVNDIADKSKAFEAGANVYMELLSSMGINLLSTPNHQ